MQDQRPQEPVREPPEPRQAGAADEMHVDVMPPSGDLPVSGYDAWGDDDDE